MKVNMQNSEKKKDMRIWISLILRAGVILSAALLISGGILFLIQHPNAVFSYKSFAGEPERLRVLNSVFREAFQFKSRPVIQLGIIILISTPVIRVIFSFLEFLFRKDWKFVIVTAIVMGTLFYSLFS